MQDSRRNPARTVGRAYRRGVVGGLALVLAVAILACPACHRAHYRRQADAEAADIIQQKLNDPRWMLPRTSIVIDPRSRMFDPFDPDHPPMPPDDPTSHELMHVVDGKPNYPHWGKDGTTQQVESPDWLKYLPLDNRGVIRLDLATAIQLALIHSPDYQEAFETLYLSALDVSAERFRFDGQLFGGSDVFYRTSGADRDLPRSRLSVDSDLALRKAFIAGGDLVVNFANSLIWDFQGNDTNAAFSLLDFSLVQPLLREAGRDRVMTRLTLAERQLLANVRQMERFRRGFYLELATGTGGTRGAQRLGGLFGGSGLEGFTGVGGGFGGVGGVFTGAAGRRLPGPPCRWVDSWGCCRTSRTSATSAPTSPVCARTSCSFSRPCVRICGRFRTTRPRSCVIACRSPRRDRICSTRNSHWPVPRPSTRPAWTTLKIDLGLPPHLPVQIEDPLLDRFNLLDSAIVPLQDHVSSLSQVVGEINERILAAVTYVETATAREARLGWTPQLARGLEQLTICLGQIESIRDELVADNLPRAEEDISRLLRVLPERRQALQHLNQKYPRVLGDQQQSEVVAQTRLPVSVDPVILDSSRLDRLEGELQQELARLQQKMQAYGPRIEQVRASLQRILSQGDGLAEQSLYEQLEQDVIFAIPGLLASLNSDLLDLSLVQARARSDSIDLVPVDLEMNLALRIAAANRRDWMNARASLVDSWRSIAFVANDLEAFLNIVAEGDLGTEGDNPLDFRSTRGTLRVGLEFDAPFTRLLERNTYREVLIDYQQSRRAYYQFVDRVSQSLRNTIRSLDLYELNFETRRLAVLSAIEQIVLNDEIQTLNEERGQAQGVTAARDIVQALSDLQDAQDAFMGVWITYEVNRRFLDYNLGTMELDARGMWIDPGPVRGGVPPYVAANCLEDEALQLAPGDCLWLDADELEVLPPVTPTVEAPSARRTDVVPTARRLIRLPAAATAG